jgi:uncharacterized membrane protein YkoI
MRPPAVSQRGHPSPGTGGYGGRSNGSAKEDMMDFRTAILAVALAVIFLLFGIGMFGISFGEEQTPAVGMQEAVRIVLTQFPSARISEIELETEDGRLVYEVELITAEGQKKELHVNAMTGGIEKVEHD